MILEGLQHEFHWICRYPDRMPTFHLKVCDSNREKSYLVNCILLFQKFRIQKVQRHATNNVASIVVNQTMPYLQSKKATR